jgi:hypothetical protein
VRTSNLVLLDCEFTVEHTLEGELDTSVALAGRNRRERVERAPSERVHPVRRLPGVGTRAVCGLEGEHGREQPRAELPLDERVGGKVDGRHQVLEVLCLDNDPLVAVVVLADLRDGPRVLAGFEDSLDIRLHVVERGAVDRGETQRRIARRHEAEISLHRQVGGTHPEQILRVCLPRGGALGTDTE